MAFCAAATVNPMHQTRGCSTAACHSAVSGRAQHSADSKRVTTLQHAQRGRECRSGGEHAFAVRCARHAHKCCKTRCGQSHTLL